ncbi:putative oxidoreductase [Trichonephila clavipes]|nr:putative oxidoreductase [Trichonephila clavipes]
MEVESVLVTGANRGIGLEFVRQLIRLTTPPKFVFATYRNENSIKELENFRDEAKDSVVILIKMGAPAKSPSEGPFPFLVTLLRRLGIPRCDWASVEDLGSVFIEHMILSYLGESSCP